MYLIKKHAHVDVSSMMYRQPLSESTKAVNNALLKDNLVSYKKYASALIFLVVSWIWHMTFNVTSCLFGLSFR